MKKRFLDDFKTEYQKANRTEAKEAAEKEQHSNDQDTLPGGATEGPAAATPAKPKTPALAADAEKSAFRKEIEAQISKELERRIVVLTKDGQHGELSQSIASTELYQQFGSPEGAFRRDLRRQVGENRRTLRLREHFPAGAAR